MSHEQPDANANIALAAFLTRLSDVLSSLDDRPASQRSCAWVREQLSFQSSSEWYQHLREEGVLNVQDCKMLESIHRLLAKADHLGTLWGAVTRQ